MMIFHVQENPELKTILFSYEATLMAHIAVIV